MKKEQHEGDFLKNLRKTMRIMRLSLFLIIMSTAMAFSATSYSQSTKLTIDLVDVTVKEAIKSIEDQSEFIFFYQDKQVDLDRKVSLQVTEQTIEEILNKLFLGTENVYVIRDRQVVIGRSERQIGKSLANLTRINTPAETELLQQKQITGKVTDTSGGPLPGVSVIVKGTTIGTVTNTDGEFSLAVPVDADILQISFVGMKMQEINLYGQTTFNVTLEEEVIGLEEVIAIGYGTQIKKNITGSVDQVTAERLEDKPVPTVGHALQGVIPNLNIEVRGGAPGSTPSFNIRGYESITGGNPLILVDGIPRDVNNLNPNDIESISILKDASAAAIYGARGAFGVILIETKRAKEQALSVNLHARLSFEKPIWKLDPVLDPYVHMTWANIAQQRANNTNAYEPFLVEQAKKWSEDPRPENAWLVKDYTLFWCGGGPEADWGQFLRDIVPTYDYSVDIQGGTKDAKYYASVGWKGEPGIVYPEYKDETFKRFNADLKVDLKITDWLHLAPSVSYVNRLHDAPHDYIGTSKWDNYVRNGVTRYGGRFPSTDIVDFPEVPGRDFSEYEGMWIDENHWVPYNLQGGRNINNYHDFYLTQKMILNPIKNFEFRGDFTYRHYNRRGEDVASRIDKLNGRFDSTVDLLGEMIYPGHSATTYVINRYNQNHYYYLNALGEYELDNSDLHYFKAMVGFNQEWNVNRGGTLQAYDMITPSTGSINATIGNQLTSASEAHLALRGVFFRLNYIYNNKYLFELSGRYDGTSRFPKEDRFGFFPSASVAWRLSEESFMDGFDFLSDLKIRGSYGELGNQGVGGYYPYISTMGMGMSWHLHESERLTYVTPSGLVSPSLTWERTQTKNIGIDVGLFNQRLTFEFDAYTRATLDMLMRKSYPSLLGTSAPQENAADLETRGWEFKTTYHGNVGSDWNYDISFNMADNLAEITKYENPTGYIGDHYVGKIMGEIWGYETVGIMQTEEDVANMADQSHFGGNWRPGDIQFRDLNDDGKINPGNNTLDDPGDRRIIGNSTPRYTYGLNTDLKYKNFSLSVFIQGVGKRDWAPPAGSHTLFFPFSGTMIQWFEVKDSWTEENRDAYFFAPYRLSTKNTATQTRYLQDASYLRLKNVVLRYEVPIENILGNMGIQRLQVYISGYNLAEITNMHQTYDPEYLWNKVMYPLSRTYTLGARLSF